MDNTHCPSCGWPLSEAYELVSRHDTSQGEVVYSRCPCGRLRAWDASGSAVLAAGGRAELGRPATAVQARGTVARGVGAVLAGVLVIAVAATLPGPAVLACLALAGVLGGLGYAWAWLTVPGGQDARVRFTARVALFGGASAVVMAGFVQLFGAASVALLLAGYVVLAMVCWVYRPFGSRTC